nr:MAG TPA: hypothetical protein [Caudoviricetes sp.]
MIVLILVYTMLRSVTTYKKRSMMDLLLCYLHKHYIGLLLVVMYLMYLLTIKVRH